MAENKKDIELRSEKVRNIVGQVPPMLLRIGIAIISLIILLVFALAYFIPYPEYLDVSVDLRSFPSVQTIVAENQGVFMADTTKVKTSIGEEICAVQTNDSVKHYFSRISGVVFYNYNNENIVEQGKTMVAVVPDSIHSVYGQCYISTDKMHGIKEGLGVQIWSNNRSISGRISKIFPIPEVSHSLKKTNCKLEIQFNTGYLNRESRYLLLLPDKSYPCRILVSKQSLLKKILNFIDN